MRFIAYTEDGTVGVAAAASDAAYRGITEGQPGYPGSLDQLITGGHNLQDAARTLLQRGTPVDPIM